MSSESSNELPKDGLDAGARSEEELREVNDEKRGSHVMADLMIVAVACVATMMFCYRLMVPHHGATRSQVLEQQERRSELEKALAEQQGYLSDVAVNERNLAAGEAGVAGKQ
ncbi:MAG: hypothetical protein RIC12_01405 [Pirellulales bacterium]